MRFLSTLAASIIGTLVALGILVLFGFLLITAFVASADTTPSVQSNSVLTMELSGALPERVAPDPIAQALGDGPRYGVHDVREALEKAAADDRIEGVIIKARELAPQWAALQEVREALLQYKESGKPLYAYTGEYYSNEAAYFLNSTADSVFASPEGFFEFNGFNLQSTFFADMLEKVGIEPTVIRAGEFKSAGEAFTRTDFSEENEEQLQAIVDGQNTVFLNAIAESRGTTAEELQRIKEESPTFTARQALDQGLLDGLLFEDEVMDVMRTRLNKNEDDDLHTIRLSRYVRIPASDAGIERGRDGTIAVVYAQGQIVPGSDDSPFGGGTMLASADFVETMRQAREDDRVNAVVVRVNSPGGSASASDAILREIALTQEEKPVVISMGDVAASGGYWIATAANAIVADPLTITGSIGVFGLHLNTSELLSDRIGLTFDQVKTAPLADFLSPTEALTEQERALFQEFVMESYNEFLEKVAEARDMTVEEVDAIAQGRVWTGADALEVGLVDELGGLSYAINRAAELVDLEPGTFRIRELPRQKTFIEQLATGFEAQAHALWARVTGAPGQALFENNLRLLREAERMHGTVQARMPYDFTIQ